MLDPAEGVLTEDKYAEAKAAYADLAQKQLEHRARKGLKQSVAKIPESFNKAKNPILKDKSYEADDELPLNAPWSRWKRGVRINKDKGLDVRSEELRRKRRVEEIQRGLDESGGDAEMEKDAEEEPEKEGDGEEQEL